MQKYSNLQIWRHWIVFILIVAQFVFHEPIAQAFERRLEGREVEPNALIGLHLFFGGAIFLLIVTRLWVRNEQGVPAYLKENAPLMEIASKVVHWSFLRGFIANASFWRICMVSTLNGCKQYT